MTKPTTISQLVANPSCMDDYDPNAMSVAQARQFINKYLSPLIETETLPIRESLGRILAKNIIAPSNVPNHNNSAMDGFAFKFVDAGKVLKVIGTAFAGNPFNGKLISGQCVKIMTGAIIPEGADTVEMQERVMVNGDEIQLTQTTKQNANIRLSGEDLKFGQTVLASRHKMNPADLGLVASLGISEVVVFRKLKVAFFSTGDELVNVGSPLLEGQIFDSNRYTLFGMLTRLGMHINDLGNVPDDPAKLEKTLLNAALINDVVITSGGVSVGEADYMKSLLTKHGQVLFWKINMKPGRPLAYGKVGEAHYFGLPGNPVSTMVTFYQFVQPALQALSGEDYKLAPILSAKCTLPLKKITGRMEFQRGVLSLSNDGAWTVAPLPNQGSGVLNSMSLANCFIVLDENVGNCEAGEMVKVQIFQGFV
jgi:molybdopterin molybdotransferase